MSGMLDARPKAVGPLPAHADEDLASSVSLRVGPIHIDSVGVCNWFAPIGAGHGGAMMPSSTNPPPIGSSSAAAAILAKTRIWSTPS